MFDSPATFLEEFQFLKADKQAGDFGWSWD